MSVNTNDMTENQNLLGGICCSLNRKNSMVGIKINTQNPM